jgi:hypothetical protein
MSRSSRKNKIAKRKAAQLHPLSESLEAAFDSIEHKASQPATETCDNRATLSQEKRSNA